ncbi:MAG: XrtA system polysaccharide deacetylase [Gemmatimonadota bacterium]
MTSHLFSVDVEEYFQVNAFESVVPRDDWDRYPTRLRPSVEVLLDLLDRHGAKGTFFTLGWVAERHPDVVRAIARRGHELASHGWWHRRIPTLTPAEFRAEVRNSKTAIEQLTGQPVTGYRAPSFSILPGFEWAFDVLLEEGYRYDSSRFPIRLPGYGSPGTNPAPHRIERPSGSLLELPPATVTWLGLRLPAAGGGWFRQLPYAFTKGAFAAWSAQGVPAMFYIHPWEVDPDQPRLPVGAVTCLRHYNGLGRTLPRLDRLLREFRFTSVAQAFPA